MQIRQDVAKQSDIVLWVSELHISQTYPGLQACMSRQTISRCKLYHLMQAAAAAAMLQQQGGQGNGQPPLSLNALQQRIIAAARQGQPGAQAQLQSLLRHQDLSAAQAMAAGMFGQMSQQTFNNQARLPFAWPAEASSLYWNSVHSHALASMTRRAPASPASVLSRRATAALVGAVSHTVSLTWRGLRRGVLVYRCLRHHRPWGNSRALLHSQARLISSRVHSPVACRPCSSREAFRAPSPALLPLTGRAPTAISRTRLHRFVL